MQQAGASHPPTGPKRNGVSKEDDTWLDPRSETSRGPRRAQGKNGNADSLFEDCSELQDNDGEH